MNTAIIRKIAIPSKDKPNEILFCLRTQSNPKEVEEEIEDELKRRTRLYLRHAFGIIIFLGYNELISMDDKIYIKWFYDYSIATSPKYKFFLDYAF